MVSYIQPKVLNTMKYTKYLAISKAKPHKKFNQSAELPIWGAEVIAVSLLLLGKALNCNNILIDIIL